MALWRQIRELVGCCTKFSQLIRILICDLHYSCRCCLHSSNQFWYFCQLHPKSIFFVLLCWRNHHSFYRLPRWKFRLEYLRTDYFLLYNITVFLVYPVKWISLPWMCTEILGEAGCLSEFQSAFQLRIPMPSAKFRSQRLKNSKERERKCNIISVRNSGRKSGQLHPSKIQNVFIVEMTSQAFFDPFQVLFLLLCKWYFSSCSQSLPNCSIFCFLFCPIFWLELMWNQTAQVHFL